jgi:hypothetical protein
MDNESEIIRILTEIRDNQVKQMESHKTYSEWAKRATAAQQRRAIIVGIVIGVGVALILWASRM